MPTSVVGKMTHRPDARRQNEPASKFILYTEVPRINMAKPGTEFVSQGSTTKFINVPTYFCKVSATFSLYEYIRISESNHYKYLHVSVLPDLFLIPVQGIIGKK
jgi:hypothetical protein